MNSYARLIALVFTLSFGFAGCSHSSVRNWGSGSGSETRRDNGPARTCTHVWLECDGRVCLVLAASGCSGTSGGTAKAEGQLQTRPGYLHAKDGRKIAWSFSTQDGKSGKVVIDGQEFDLGQGTLFLVSVSDKPTGVTQLSIDSNQSQALARGSFLEHLVDFSKDEPRIATFLESCKESE